jgi:hypothetical protein
MGKEMERLRRRKGCIHFGSKPLTEKEAGKINAELDKIDKRHSLPKNAKLGK